MSKLDIVYTIMRLWGYTSYPTNDIFKALHHHHPSTPIMNKCSNSSKDDKFQGHKVHEYTEYYKKGDSTQYKDKLLTYVDEELRRDLMNRRSLTSSIHLLNSIVIP